VAYPEIRPADPGEAGVRALILAQLEFGRAASPPEDANALAPEAFAGPGVALFAAVRARRLGRAMLDRLLAEARDRGYRRVRLETGAMDAFAPARALYESAGFTPCAPFADYVASENSVYLSLPLID
jgi:putative acetyltransferase